MEQEKIIPKRILNQLIAALSAGVVPRTGAPYIAIGRNEEIAALLDSMSRVSEGGAFVRFLIGRYGSGKSFLIQLLRGYAMERGFLTADCDLSTDQRRLCGGNGAGLATYRELLQNLASKAAPDGGALPLVLSRHYTSILSRLAENGVFPESNGFLAALQKEVFSTFSALENSVGGFDFARVLSAYFMAMAEENEERKSACLKWLRGEFSNKTEAKAELGFRVSGIVDDENWYDYIKLWAVFARHIGYTGLIIYIDECIILYKIVNRVARENNYEKILTIFNDTLQGRAEGLGVIFGGTPQFLEDTRRGLFSYEALRSRLADSRFADAGYATLSSPVIRLRRLSDNELYALLCRLSKLHAVQRGENELLSEEQLREFLSFSLSRAGASELLTPREMIRDFMTLLNILSENEGATFESLLHAKREDVSVLQDENEEIGVSLSEFSL
ncbi:MAG: biotin carboxylase [Ruminococcaceae bacterium]|nr:biotin carboxylase [Oscillospiraceae bacterium]